jgi:acyl-coenzyme A synthetase/AMP-(fatty) acid ligase
MDVLGDLVVRDRRSDRPALRAAESGRLYDYRRFCTTAWKVGNYLRLLGVRTGAGVAVADDPNPEAILSAYGGALLGGVVRFGPLRDTELDARVLVTPTADVNEYAVGPSTKRVVYGSEPADPDVGYFERDVWSENPTQPPDRVAPTAGLLDADRTYTHAEVLNAAADVAETWKLEPGDEVAVRAPFGHPGTVAAGLVAPILAGAVVLLPGEAGVGDYAVGGDGPEPEVLDPADVF